LIKKGAIEPLIKLKGQIIEIEANPSITKERSPQIIDSERMAYGRKKGLRFETPEARITE
jgi:hypothetical protein